ncbi:MAG: phosphoribosylformylglycinamidine cyclo-ligase [Nitrospirota bacterium]|nr:phosphoribosylformylglycinamidine cyclo-ligase [Nitrospirota bacterium]
MTNYREAGVDIDAGDEFVRRIRPLVQRTSRKEVLGNIGGFGGLFRFPSDQYQDPVLISGTDGVGTKLKIAFMMNQHDTVGIDLVAMCVNDIVVSGAEPLFFLDYLAVGELVIDQAASIVAGIAEGCQQAGCALIGGETAEMPSFYQPQEYDLAGFAVGVVERANLISGDSIKAGDVLIGLASTGLHSNGYSLARKVFFEQSTMNPESVLTGLDASLGEVLLAPTRVYVSTVLQLLKEFPISGMAHITGGGLTGNVPRILPPDHVAVIDRTTWSVPAVFSHLQELGAIPVDEMYRVFNMGIGFVLIVPAEHAQGLVIRAEELGEEAFQIGRIRKASGVIPTVEYSET